MKLFLWKWVTRFSPRFIVLLILFLQISFNQYGVNVEDFKLHASVSFWINVSLKHFKNEPFSIVTGAGSVSNLKNTYYEFIES